MDTVAFQNLTDAALRLGFPDGGVCVWRALGSDAAAILGVLGSCTGLPVESGAEAAKAALGVDGVLRLLGVDQLRPGGWALRRQGLRAYRRGEGEFDVVVAPWEKTTTSLRGWMVRQLFFLGVLPRLLKKRSFLVHGGLAAVERGGGAEGFLFCGPSGIGKSTTMRRLVPEFRVLGDDAVLLTEVNGVWFAQPVPTWSLWTTGKPGHRFECRGAVKLARVCLLERGEHAVSELRRNEFRLGVTPSFTDMARWFVRDYPREIGTGLFEDAMAAASELCRVVPGCRFTVKLDENLVGGLLL